MRETSSESWKCDLCTGLCDRHEGIDRRTTGDDDGSRRSDSHRSGHQTDPSRFAPRSLDTLQLQQSPCKGHCGTCDKSGRLRGLLVEHKFDCKNGACHPKAEPQDSHPNPQRCILTNSVVLCIFVYSKMKVGDCVRPFPLGTKCQDVLWPWLGL
jgi:hypothetical protein